jgi:hypothetical protein
MPLVSSSLHGADSCCYRRSHPLLKGSPHKCDPRHGYGHNLPGTKRVFPPPCWQDGSKTIDRVKTGGWTVHEYGIQEVGKAAANLAMRYKVYCPGR